MRCPKCGQPNDDWAYSCRLCSEPLPRPYHQQYGMQAGVPDHRIERAIFWLLIILIVLIAVSVIAGLLFWDRMLDEFTGVLTPEPGVLKIQRIAAPAGTLALGCGRSMS